MAQQLDLFAGAHVPLTRCLAALEEGDLRAAQEALAEAAPGAGAAADRRRLAEIAARLPPVGDAGSVSADGVHTAFEAALTAEGFESASGEIPAGIWFRLYARHVAGALDAGSVRLFRGWYALDFLLAAGRADAALRGAQRFVAACRQGHARLEAARAAWAAGEGGLMARWVVLACLESTDALDPAPPPIAASAVPALDPPPGALPRLAPAIETLWDTAEALDLPVPTSAWVPALGMIDGVFSPSLFGWSEDLKEAGFDPAEPAPAWEPAPRGFVRALLAARHARAAAAAPSVGTQCGPAELVARRDMKRLAPQLLARYLARLEAASVRG